MFLNVTFQENDILFHKKPILSSNIFLPFLGATGLSNVAGAFFSSFLHATTVTAVIIIQATSMQDDNIDALYWYVSSGKFAGKHVYTNGGIIYVPAK